MNRKMLIMNEKDNVGVLLEYAETGDSCIHKNGPIKVMERIEFGHKIALENISKGASVFKYGEEIGFALEDIQKGKWVHNHNMGCKRGK